MALFTYPVSNKLLTYRSLKSSNYPLISSLLFTIFTALNSLSLSRNYSCRYITAKYLMIPRYTSHKFPSNGFILPRRPIRNRISILKLPIQKLPYNAITEWTKILGGLS
ncbi:hypothetical protein DSO57_1030483 [Entomophthora muscae]|uniref:Uncharacterized protein n=1 Tax=Entomophthora muscae TaxID=34485 RepID=A0ACC2T0Z7_9FUNG|nr:hypothetical protein DSO57_1030483 [Entomophthora muscae]